MTDQTANDELQTYVRHRSPEAFRRLVDRYVDLVYAAARRQVRDAALAEDVTQAVFMILAEKAGTLRPDRPLSAWLLRVTAYASSNARRTRARQAHHERKAAEMATNRMTSGVTGESDWDEWAPLLDEGINRLRPRDRDAIVLRYFEQKSSREVAASLGITEEAAAKRIERAVRRLREFFARRGATVSAAALSATILAHSTEAAPAQLGASIAGSATAGVGASVAVSSIAKGAIVAMTYAKAKMVLISAVAGVLLVGGAGVVIVKTVGSPDTADARPAAAAAADAAATQVTQWPVTFSDGSTAELVGITDSPASGQWWAPDGSPIPAPAIVPPNISSIWVPDSARGFRLIIRHEGPTLRDTYLGVTIAQRHPSEGNTGIPGGLNTRVIGYTVAVPKEHAAVDVLLHLARGPWTIDERYTLPAGGAPAASVEKPSLNILSVDEKDGAVLVTVAGSFGPGVPGEDQVHVVSSAGGREYSYDQASSGPANGAVYRFPIRKDQAVALVHRWRPYEIREIRNVSLQSGVRTDVTVPPAQ